MGLYHLKVKIISRGSGRSAVGSAAYRSATRAVAYRSGGNMRDKGGIVHDYRYKTGVAHSEIILPEGAPPEYADRQTLWNAVDTSEKRKDARLAREVVVALQRDFELAEQIALLREFIQENFVDKGMIADLNIHDKGDGNPHAHIMLTTRHVTPEGFGKKNRDWDKRENLLVWRKNWADINNRMFAEKGLDGRIDHRSYKARGIDREPTIHMGHEATALERKGVKTERGNYNREIQRRNAEREAREIAFESSEGDDNKEPPELKKERVDPREVEKAARRVEKIWEERRAQDLKELEEYLKAAKAEKIAEEMRERQSIAEDMHETRENYIALEKEFNRQKYEYNTENQELPPLRYLTQKAGEYVKSIAELRGEGAQLQKMRQSLSWRDWGRKAEIDDKIRQVEQKIAQEQDILKNRFHIDPAHAHVELKRLQGEIREKEHRANIRAARIQEIEEKQEAVKLDYHTQKLLNETRHDYQKIEKLLENMSKPPESIRERLLHEQITRRLNTITDENFREVIKNLPENQAKMLISHVEAKKLNNARRLLRDKIERERSRADERCR